jgi:hypothetical protein
VGFWTRVLLPQILGQELPEVVAQNQKPSAAAPPVNKLGSSEVEAVLGYMEDTLSASAPVARANGKVGPPPPKYHPTTPVSSFVLGSYYMILAVGGGLYLCEVNIQSFA